MLTFLEKFREAKTLLQWIEARVPQYGSQRLAVLG